MLALMTTTKDPPTPSPGPDVASIATGLLQGREPLEVALAAWREKRKLKLTEVSEMAGYSKSALSGMLHRPERLPGVRRAVAKLIGYEERGDGS